VRSPLASGGFNSLHIRGRDREKEAHGRGLQGRKKTHSRCGVEGKGKGE